MAHHALVFGASGILGWAVVNEILNNYPEKGTYGKVTALTNRPLSLEDSLWPAPGPGTPELKLVSGIDLTHGTAETLIETLKERISDIDTVDHVFYFGTPAQTHTNPKHTILNPPHSIQVPPRLPHGDDPQPPDARTQLRRPRSPSPKHELRDPPHRDQGARRPQPLPPSRLPPPQSNPPQKQGYGIHLPHRPFPAPFTETMSTLPPPHRSQLFYYPLRDALTNRQQHAKSWRWAELRTDMVVGFVPHPNPYNLAGTLGNYLSLYRFLHERGHPSAPSRTVPYPSPAPSFHIRNNEGNAAVFAHAALHMCLHPDRAGNGELYNVGGEAEPATYADRWPAMAAVFGLEGGGPGEVRGGGAVGFVREHGGEVEALAREKGVVLQGVENEEGFDAWMAVFDFDHHFELGKLRGTGFGEEVGAGELWRAVWELYARAGRCYLGHGNQPA